MWGLVSSLDNWAPFGHSHGLYLAGQLLQPHNDAVCTSGGSASWVCMWAPLRGGCPLPTGPQDGWAVGVFVALRLTQRLFLYLSKNDIFGGMGTIFNFKRFKYFS